MTTAHRPTFDPARGGTGRNEGDLSKLSVQYSSKDMPSHTKLKYRSVGARCMMVWFLDFFVHHAMIFMLQSGSVDISCAAREVFFDW